MNTSSINCFLSLGRTLNYSRTAEEMFMTQQAVSKNITKLENEFGVQLFKRDHHKVEITPAGKKYYDLFTAFKKKFDSLQLELEGSEGASYPELRVGLQAGLYFGSVLNSVQKTMLEGYRNFSHSFERQAPKNLQELMLANKLDLIIVYRRFIPKEPGLGIKKLADLPIIMGVSKDNPKAVPSSTYKDFMDLPLIFDSVEESGHKSSFKQEAKNYARKLNLEPANIIVVNNRETAFTAAEQNKGFVISTTLNNITNNPMFRFYPMEKHEELVAVWNKEAEHALTQGYISAFAGLMTDHIKEVTSPFRL